MYPDPRSIRRIPDGTSMTLLIGETHGVNANGDGAKGEWNWMGGWCVASTVWGINAAGVGALGSPIETWQAGICFRSLHPGGAQFTMCDGSVQFLDEDINLRLFGYLGGRKDAQIIELP